MAAAEQRASANGRSAVGERDSERELAAESGSEAQPTARYVAIITDGNGRWAREHGLSVNEGHNAGADTVKAR
jgi:undecaprenyl pyrophosphate synthase